MLWYSLDFFVVMVTTLGLVGIGGSTGKFYLTYSLQKQKLQPKYGWIAVLLNLVS